MGFFSMRSTGEKVFIALAVMVVLAAVPTLIDGLVGGETAAAPKPAAAPSTLRPETIAFCEHVKRYDDITRDYREYRSENRPTPSAADNVAGPNGDFFLYSLGLGLAASGYFDAVALAADASQALEAEEKFRELRDDVLRLCRTVGVN
jgi:hypothetical protein